MSPLDEHDREWIAECNAASARLTEMGVFEDRVYQGGVIVDAASSIAERRLTAKERGQLRRQAELDRPAGKEVGHFSGFASGMNDRRQTSGGTYGALKGSKL